MQTPTVTTNNTRQNTTFIHTDTHTPTRQKSRLVIIHYRYRSCSASHHQPAYTLHHPPAYILQAQYSQTYSCKQTNTTFQKIGYKKRITHRDNIRKLTVTPHSQNTKRGNQLPHTSTQIRHIEGAPTKTLETQHLHSLETPYTVFQTNTQIKTPNIPR